MDPFAASHVRLIKYLVLSAGMRVMRCLEFGGRGGRIFGPVGRCQRGVQLELLITDVTLGGKDEMW